MAWAVAVRGKEDSTEKKRDKDKIIKKTSMRKAKVEEFQRKRSSVRASNF